MEYIGEISALATAVLWTGSSLAFASATTRVGSIYVNVTRLVLAVGFLLATIVICGMDTGISVVQAGYLLLSGLAGFVFGDTFLFKSYEYNNARVGALVMSTAPALSALLAFLFLDERLSFSAIGGMAVTLAGIALVILERTEHETHRIPVSMIGIFYAFLGSAGQAGGYILAKGAFLHGPVNGFVATFVRAAAATAVLAPMNYFAGRFTRPVRIFRDDRKAFRYTVIGAILGPYLGVTFSLISVAHTDVAIASTIIATVPIIMLPASWLIVRERLSWRAVAGACIAVAGVGVLFLR